MVCLKDQLIHEDEVCRFMHDLSQYLMNKMIDWMIGNLPNQNFVY